MTETAGPKTIAPSGAGEKPLLEVRGLSVVFDTPEGSHQVVDNVDLKVAAGRTLGLVGESGSGKSVTCLAVLPGMVIFFLSLSIAIVGDWLRDRLDPTLK